LLTLAIESSCDESSVALVEDRRVLANLVFSQEAAHAPFGGVVPELAARAHLRKLPALVRTALERAELRGTDVDLVAVTRGPGLIGSLLVGIGLAQGLARGWGKPLQGVNHLWGHVYAAMLARPELEPPLLALVVSGAHSDLVYMPAHGVFEVLGRTRDDAAGEAFDKAARMLGLGYPGGPALDRLARKGDPTRWPLPVPSVPGLEYSFSGLKTALLYRLRDLGGVEALDEATRADLAAAFERSVVESLLEKVRLAQGRWPVPEVVRKGARLTVPPLGLCTDNAAMIAAAAAHTPDGSGVGADASLGW
jgi:N6-L-threonylcarbamoyladenine synthase